MSSVAARSHPGDFGQHDCFGLPALVEAAVHLFRAELAASLQAGRHS
jgi:hypothetical protein